jgi:hypothetical protein
VRKVQELQQQIQKLSGEELAELFDWFREQEWDAQIEADAKSGKLDKLVVETSQHRYRELVDGKVKGVPGPLVFGRLRAELDRHLDAYEADGNPGRPEEDVIADIKKRL